MMLSVFHDYVLNVDNMVFLFISIFHYLLPAIFLKIPLDTLKIFNVLLCGLQVLFNLTLGLLNITADFLLALKVILKLKIKRTQSQRISFNAYQIT